jgi:hypothetical protein
MRNGVHRMHGGRRIRILGFEKGFCNRNHANGIVEPQFFS